MKIIILDGYTLNPGDLSWDELETLGKLEVFDRTPAEKVLERCKDAEVIFTNKTPLNADVIRQLDKLKYIGVLATGYNVVDVNQARQQGILVANVPGYGTDSVAQFTMALLLELCHHVQRHSDSVKNGKWAKSADFCFWDYPLIELAGKTMGIIGFGDIGRKVADIAAAFGMHVVATSRTQTNQSHRLNFQWVDLDALLEMSDVVSIHCPLFPETMGLINETTLGKMKRSAFLLNTSRGPIVVDKDLDDALKNGIIAGAAIDVLSIEPPLADNPLYEAEQCLITPHIAWASKEARQRLMSTAVENLAAFLAGRPLNIVNP